MTTGKDLASKLDVARSTLSEATNKGYLVGGKYDVQEWAVFSPNGRVKGYNVPPEVGLGERYRRSLNESLSPEVDLGERPNPSESGADAPNEPNTVPNAALADAKEIMDKLRENAQAGQSDSPSVNASLVPHGTNVDASVSAGGASHVFGKAIEHDDATIKVAGLTLVGAVTGYYLSERTGWGTLVGALVSFGIGAFGEGWGQRNVDTAGEDRAIEGSNPSALARRGDQQPANGQAAPFSPRSSRGNAQNPSSNGFSSGRQGGITIG